MRGHPPISTRSPHVASFEPQEVKCPVFYKSLGNRRRVSLLPIRDNPEHLAL
jgi:hypothetical protein